jgi:subtilase family serine protease
MKLTRILAVLALCTSATLAAEAAARPHLAIGPQAARSQAANASSPLYTCQVGLTPGVVCYDPTQMRHAYGTDKLIDAGYAGATRTIVIIDAFQSPFLEDDLDAFDGDYGLPDRSTFFTQVAPDGLTPFDFGDDNMVGWSAEITLDVEWAHAIAPDAKIVLVLAKSNDDADILSATKYAVDNRLGDVISMSFGENESCVDPDLLAQQHELFARATRKRITLIASSGDQGAAQKTCDGTSWTQAASSPAVDPLVVAVGGTELHAADYCLDFLGCDPTVSPLPGAYEGEIAWSEFSSDTEATGGGFSKLFRQPSYQDGWVQHKGSHKGVPDVAYNAAIYHGVLVYWAGGVYLFGGTSAGSPQWAAITAIADQKADRSLGFLNAALYLDDDSHRAYARNYHDVTDGNNSVSETDASLNEVLVQGFDAGRRWDATTGLGSPIADKLVKVLTHTVSFDDAREAIEDSAPSRGGHHGHEHVRPH